MGLGVKRAKVSARNKQRCETKTTDPVAAKTASQPASGALSFLPSNVRIRISGPKITSSERTDVLGNRSVSL